MVDTDILDDDRGVDDIAAIGTLALDTLRAKGVKVGMPALAALVVDWNGAFHEYGREEVKLGGTGGRKGREGTCRAMLRGGGDTPSSEGDSTGGGSPTVGPETGVARAENGEWKAGSVVSLLAW